VYPEDEATELPYLDQQELRHRVCWKERSGDVSWAILPSWSLQEREWTLQALHLACSDARSNGNQLVLLRMVPVGRPMALGVRPIKLTVREQSNIMEYALLVDGHSVSFSICVFQYITYLHTLASAAEQLDAGIIFASFPEELTASWRQIKVWWLKLTRMRHRRSLRVLERGSTISCQYVEA
jgi:hypothetical protein